jgi:hypothetical protein
MCGSRVFWQLPAYYQFMQFSTYGAKASSWISRSRRQWDKHWGDEAGMSQLIESTMVTGRNVEVKKNVNFEDRCVPVPAVSTFGLALMLSWAIKKAEGVIADPGSEASNAVTLVDRMVATACELRIGEPPWQIKLIFVAKWRPAWPRQASSTDESSFVSLPVVDDDSVDLSEWRDLAVSGLCSMASEAWKAISKRAWRGGHTIKITRLHQTFLDFGCRF